MSDLVYAGDIAPDGCWEMLRTNPNAQIIDVRTDAEFSYVGIPDLTSIDKEVHKICWKLFPGMEVNPTFEAEVLALGCTNEQPLLFLCRSGVRSRHAAAAITTIGFSHCYNITEGFEGDKDDRKHRGVVNGWKVRGLPWIQG